MFAELGELVPAGRYTLLHDALYIAARALPGGGVIILTTDGVDENSAESVSPAPSCGPAM